MEGYNGRETLQSLLAKALAATLDGKARSESWKLRLRNVLGPDGQGEFTLMNHLRGHKRAPSTSIFGDLSRYEAGRQQAIIDQVDGAAEMAVSLLAPKDKQEFLDGMLWWLVSGNHVLAVQGRSARWRLFESYLSWLLIEQTGVLDRSVSVVLQPQLKTTGAKLAHTKVRGLSLSGAVPKSRLSELEPDDGMVVAGHDVLKGSAASSSSVWEALRTLMPDNKGLRRLMERLPDGEELGFKFLLTFPSKRAMPNQVEFSSVQHAFDALDDADVEILTEQGAVKLSDMLQAPENRTNILNHGGIWDRDDLYSAFGEAWTHMVEQGTITT